LKVTPERASETSGESGIPLQETEKIITTDLDQLTVTLCADRRRSWRICQNSEFSKYSSTGYDGKNWVRVIDHYLQTSRPDDIQIV
jgi:hypothetical protein